MMDRRGFLSAILAAGIAPAIVKAANLMPVRRPSGLLLLDDFAGSGDLIAHVADGPRLQIFSGALPRTADEAIRSATLLATIALDANAATHGAITMKGDGVSAVSGRASFARIDMGGGRVIQMPVGFGSGDFVLAHPDFVPGMPLSVQASLTEGPVYHSPRMSRAMVEAMLEGRPPHQPHHK